jgi:hypothetical protein
MNDALKQLIEANQAPLSAAAAELVALLRDPDTAVTEADFFPPDDLLSSDPPMFVFDLRRKDTGVAILRKAVPWSPRLEQDHLWPLRIRMTRPESEAIRFGTDLQHRLTYLDIVYGKDYVGAVLWEMVHARYSSVDVVAKTLGRITHYPPHRSEHLVQCQAEIGEVFDSYQNTLIVEMRYPTDLGRRVFIAAIVYMLDRRNMLTIRSALFPPSGSFSM